MSRIEHPLDIGAGDLLRGVEFTYCGDIDVLCKNFLGYKWKHRYVIISQGCLYIYSDRKAKRPDQSHSFREFDSARDSSAVNKESICFCLNDNTGQNTISFACDTSENRTKWIQQFNTAISEVRGTYYSADSGFGSAETVPNNKQKTIRETDEYDEVDNRQFPQSTRLPVQPCDDDGDYEEPTFMSDLYVNNIKTREYIDYRSSMKTESQKQKSTELMNELKHQVENKLPNLPLQPPAKVRTRPSPPPKPTSNRLSAPSPDTSFSGKTPSLRFCSVRGGPSLSIQESFSELSVRGAESLYENNESDSSGDSDTTSPKVIYENPESLVKNFRRADYICEARGVGKRLLKKMPVGYFAVFPADESSEHALLCVMTPDGLKYFRIYSQGFEFSLYKEKKVHKFASVDELLTFYSMNNLPSEEYSVKLQNGYKSVS